MMKKHFRSRVPWLAILPLTLLAAPAYAQVPQHMTYTGRLVDNLGAPLAGPVNLDLRILPMESGGTSTSNCCTDNGPGNPGCDEPTCESTVCALDSFCCSTSWDRACSDLAVQNCGLCVDGSIYKEEHLGVPLDATGAFSVQLGAGQNPTGSFNAGVFSGAERWLEVVVNGEVLSPRHTIASVPWALVSEQANKIVKNPNAPRFEDCGDGTVADNKTGLQWEKKTGTVSSDVFCDDPIGSNNNCPDPHDVNNRYPWSLNSPIPDGAVFADFLPRLNGYHLPHTPTDCFAGHCDWRLPEIIELQTIMIGPEAAPGQAATCGSAPCIDPDFALVGGPTASSETAPFGAYWSATPYFSAGISFSDSIVWSALFINGSVDDQGKAADYYVRAVRAGSCN